MLNAGPSLKHEKGSYTVKFRVSAFGLLAASLLPGCTNRNLSPQDTLTISTGSPITTLNPLYATDAGSQHTSELIHAPLVVANAKFLPEPYLAESFRIVSPTVIEFRLRQGCRFQSGRELTVADVERSLDFFRDERNQSSFAESFRRIVKFEPVDARTFRLHTARPAPSLLADLEILKVMDLDGIAPGSRPASIPGAGPYRLVSANTSLVELARAEASCLPSPPLARVKIKTVRDDLSRFLKLKTGEVDAVMNELNYRKVEAIYADPSLPLQISVSDGIGYTYLGVNTRRGPLRDKRVRRALALSFDVPALIRYKSRGMANVARNLLEDQNYYANLKVSKVERNLPEARRLLNEAGFSDGKNGKPPLRLTLLISTASFNIENGSVLVAQAADAGIELKLKALEWGIFYSDVKAGNTELYLMRWVGVTDPRIYFEAFHSGEVGKGNRTFFSNPQVDKLTAEGEITMDPAARKKIYDEVQSIVAEELPYIGLWYGKNVIVSRKEVKKFNVGAFGLLADSPESEQRMRRFFVEGELAVGARARLSPEETKHAARVLRLLPGAEVLLLNGRGLEAKAKLLSLEPEGAEAEITEVKVVAKAVRLELLQAPLKGPKMDWLVEKLTELGVDALRPARTERTVAAGEKEDRWARIAQAAVKQSGNATFPKLHPLASLDEVLAQLPSEATKVHLQPGAAASLHEVIAGAKARGARTVVLAIGPEGGFSAAEEAKLTQAGFHPASLSRQVLRGETAALAALAIAAHCIDFSA